MNLIQKIIYFFILACLISACKATNDSKEIQTIYIHNEAAQSLTPVDHYFESIEFVKIKMPKKNFVAYIDKIQTFQNHLYIHDSQSNKLLLFDKNGNFKKQIGINGQGPGEYLEIDIFYIDPYRQEVIIYDNGNQKTIFYDFLGNFIRESKFELYFGDRTMLNKNISVLFTKGYNNQHFTKEKNYKFIFVNQENKTFKGLEIFQNPLLSLTKSRTLNNFSKYENKILFCESFSDTISEINQDIRKARYLLKYQKKSSKITFYENPQLKYDAREAIKENYPFLEDYFIENQKGCFFNYIYNNGGRHFVVYDKKAKSTQINTRSITYKKSSVPIPTYWSGEAFVAVMSPETVKFFRDISPLVKQQTSESDTDANTNQVLVFFKPK